MLSRGARWTIATAAAITALGMGLVASDNALSSGPGWLFVAFCLVIFVLCIAPHSAPVTARLIGLTLLACGVWYCVDVLSGTHAPERSRLRTYSDLIMYLLVFGLPGGYLFYRGRLPIWSDFYGLFHDGQAAHDGDHDSATESRDGRPGGGARKGH